MNDDIQTLKEHIEELYHRVYMLSMHNADSYNQNIDNSDGYSVHTEPCQSTQWNIWTVGLVSNQADVSVYVSTGACNEYKQVLAKVTINGSHIQIDLDFPGTGYVVYREAASSSTTSPTYPTIFCEDDVILPSEIPKVVELNMTSVNIVEETVTPGATINEQPF